ncbi:hypothetical protein D3C81_1563930 [compost metagenome]
MDGARHCAIGVKPAFKMAAVRAVRAKGINTAAVNVAGPLYGGVSVRGNDHHLLKVDRHAFQSRVGDRAIDKGGAQRPLQYTVQHGA